jgi:DNA helicase IV
MAMLERPRVASLSEIRWSEADAALIDEARILLGPVRRPRSAHRPEVDVLDGIDLDAYSGDVRQAALREASRLAAGSRDELDEAEFVTYGHIVVDEAQDLSPMQLRVLKRRDLAGSMTIVGDMGQATTAASSASWDVLLEVLEPRREPTRVTLSVSYRTPEEVLDFAQATLRASTSGVEPPKPVRRVGVAPIVEQVAERGIADALVGAARRELAAVDPGRVAVVISDARVDEAVTALRAGGLDAVDPRVAGSRGLASDLVVIGAEGAHGLEFDAVVVVEPAEIAARGSSDGSPTPRGLRTLYVALTRPTRRLSVLHERPLPPTLL